METWGSHALLFCDEGKDDYYRKLTRKLRAYNPVPSMYGGWGPDADPYKNIPLTRIIEDPVFRKSEDCFFIQTCDFCAYALLRRESPIESKSRYGLDKAFDLLKPILFLDANRKDPEGIIRVK